MRKIILLLLIIVSSFMISWHAPGHMTGGAIAYYYLKENNPEVLQKVLKSLEKHPWFSAKWADTTAGLTAEEKKIALFMLASIYPDDIKRIPALDDKEQHLWHYIDYPYVPEGETVEGKPPLIPNAEEKLDSLMIALKNDHDSKERAIGLCWLFHIIEDIHQPLHTAQLFTTDHPDGDRGGNSTFITINSSTHPTVLHSYWDGLITGTIKNIPAKADTLIHRDEFKESNLAELTTDTTFKMWIKNESLEFAKNDVYKKGKIAGTKSNPSPVDQEYITNAKTIAQKRIVLAGIRLAKKLIEIYS
jgi:hypothetical protein